MNKLPTRFAPAERATASEVKRQYELISNIDQIRNFLDKIPHLIMILNKERQVVYCSRGVLDTLKINDPMKITGFRPGEILSCIHSTEPGGCGTSEHCSACGAVLSILTTLNESRSDERECRINCASNGTMHSLDLKVWTETLIVDNEKFIIFSAKDIGDEKRRNMLEKTFLHDVLNIASGLQNCSELIMTNMVDDQQNDEIITLIKDLSAQLVSELNAHRLLIASENFELQVQPEFVNSLDVVNNIVKLYQKSSQFKNKIIQLDPNFEEIAFISDSLVLSRILGNMVKNAMEAIEADEKVTVGCYRSDPNIQFWVHNPRMIPKHIQLQIFQRSFSTKGAHRGIGTYSIKLLGEHYLKGKVNFSSSVESGTTFYIECPVDLDKALEEN